MNIGNLSRVVLTALLVTAAGCSDIQSGQSGDESQTSSELTGCELDCPTGQVYTCPGTCSVTATSLNCNGVVTNCPTPPAVCGDGIVEAGEACDDGNNASFDKCSPDCLHACTGTLIYCDCLLPGRCESSANCTRDCRL